MQNYCKERNRQPVSRRKFLQHAVAASAAMDLALAQGQQNKLSPSEKLNVAAIGAGGQAGSNIQSLMRTGRVNIVALCDVDDQRAAGTYKQFPTVPKFKDFRRMLDGVKDVDAVLVATPDHLHAPG